MNYENRKGELTSQQLITIIILIVSFGVILIFLFVSNWKSDVVKESCRNSVILRGTELGKNTKLSCSTQDVCISGGGDCANMGKNSQTVKVRNKGELFDELSNRMYDCWWQMGEGKIDYAPKGLGFSETYCAICDSVKFDEKSKNDFKNIKMGEFYSYLQSKKVPNEDYSYLYYLYGMNNLDAVRDSFLNFKDEKGNQLVDENGNKIDLYEQPLDLSGENGYAIITATTHQGWGSEIVATSVGAAAGITVGLITANPVAGAGTFRVAIGAISKYLSIVGFAPSGRSGALASGVTAMYINKGNAKFMPPMIYPYKGEVIGSLSCKEFTTLA